jgi:hypothetical protein
MKYCPKCNVWWKCVVIATCLICGTLLYSGPDEANRHREVTPPVTTVWESFSTGSAVSSARTISEEWDDTS